MYPAPRLLCFEFAGHWLVFSRENTHLLQSTLLDTDSFWPDSSISIVIVKHCVVLTGLHHARTSRLSNTSWSLKIRLTISPFAWAKLLLRKQHCRNTRKGRQIAVYKQVASFFSIITVFCIVFYEWLINSTKFIIATSKYCN